MSLSSFVLPGVFAAACYLGGRGVRVLATRFKKGLHGETPQGQRQTIRGAPSTSSATTTR
jgi:hypothetical protein